MSDAWEEIQAVKNKREKLREKLEKRKKERLNILSSSLGDVKTEQPIKREPSSPVTVKSEIRECSTDPTPKPLPLESVERRLLRRLSDLQLQLPTTARDLLPGLGQVDARIVDNLLQKFATQKLITIRERVALADPNIDPGVEVVSAESVHLAAVLAALSEDGNHTLTPAGEVSQVGRKRKGEEDSDEVIGSKVLKSNPEDKKSIKKEEDTDIMSLLAMQSSREKAVKRVGEEILDLLSKPTAKEKSLADKFKSQGGAQVMEFCPQGTRAECIRNHNTQKQTLDSSDLTDVKLEGKPVSLIGYVCRKLHFKKIIQGHTDETLGDCSFLNTCFHMDTCKYVHYEVDNSDPHATTSKCTESSKTPHNGAVTTSGGVTDVLTLHPPQWVQCDLRYLDMNFLGKFAVIMADPPWDIHMELPYGTMSDDEMRRLGVPQLQDSGLIFLWVTGRAMELGRECLKLWGYDRVDELIWVKTNQLQRIIRTGRTGHWLNHGKEHCLVGMKGDPENLNRGLDCDVIVAEVRATSHKPDEIYGIIERLSPGTRKIELFGRPHNVQPNWITLGNQVDGVRLVDPELIAAFKKRYPDGNCMAPPPELS